MKVLVISDSHQKLDTLMKIYEKERPEVVICAGDHSRDGEELSFIYPDSKYYIVRGNCDIFDRRYDDEMLVELEGIKILLAHGHEYGVKRSYASIEKRGLELGCDIIIFGHTHIQYLSSKNGITLFNPGSVYGREYGVLEIIENKFQFYHKSI
ncbi:Putative metallophosphoesterase MG207 homolog [Fusobacterium necrogenes]|uniref:Phosphoesterase n=1 Tax=Fusobacterium necrogenes TaxID=858 RepID=A0A377H092_9FUSO|nr:metallophosphoesterase [Fusobacterium necrogenes]STO32244.1 Putative metallophosphoesterase MG207 homolog [Fusobacterium necrogenes]